VNGPTGRARHGVLSVPAVSPRRWPDVAPVPWAPARARVARAVVGRLAGRVDVAIRLPDGSFAGPGPDQRPVMEIRSGRLFHRLGRDLRIGLAESYLAGEWGPGPGTDLGDLLTAFAEHLGELVPRSIARFRRLVEPGPPTRERNSPQGAQANVARHYDLSNELFALFLDETMTYSSAWFAAEGDDLASAQVAKFDRLLDETGVGADTRLLEIGSGWGQLAMQAARRGATVRTITLSVAQQRLARQRIADAGLAERVSVELCDYRAVHDTYDAVVSVEMIEAVGEEYLADYFDAVAGALVPGGRFGLQAITMPHARVVATRHAHSWVHKYIFPGGFVPSLDLIEGHARAAGLVPAAGALSLRTDYARTLREWREGFIGARADVRGLGFDDVFVRLWELYLATSEAGFRSGQLDDWQLVFRSR
jgi:cyclopropane-fatty-acyl-phospholipid synthase